MSLGPSPVSCLPAELCTARGQPGTHSWTPRLCCHCLSPGPHLPPPQNVWDKLFQPHCSAVPDPSGAPVLFLLGKGPNLLAWHLGPCNPGFGGQPHSLPVPHYGELLEGPEYLLAWPHGSLPWLQSRGGGWAEHICPSGLPPFRFSPRHSSVWERELFEAPI